MPNIIVILYMTDVYYKIDIQVNVMGVNNYIPDVSSGKLKTLFDVMPQFDCSWCIARILRM